MTLETGSIIGRWTLLKPDNTRRYYWNCRCTCGTIRSIRDSSLKSGHSSSCGCVRTQVISSRKTHGMTNTVEYRTWQWMRYRVSHDQNYTDVNVCPRWQEFENFYADMGTRPDGEFSLGRVDNAGPYSKNNCRWETPTMQNRNKGNNVQIESQNLGTRTLTEWADILLVRTGNTSWTPRKLKSFLDTWSIDKILQTEGIADLSTADCADDYELVAA
jgi:hypothetical protein